MWVNWLFNVLILIGMYRIRHKCRSAFLWSAAGETGWTVTSAMEGRYDLSFICGIFVVVALLNYQKWSKEENVPNT